MAVVPRAEETVLGAAPGSPFPGNLLGTHMTCSVHSPGARASSDPSRIPEPLVLLSFPSTTLLFLLQMLMITLAAGSEGLDLNPTL